MVSQALPCSFVKHLTAHYRPSHKLVCREPKAAAKFKFVSTLMGNEYIEFHFIEAFILTFKLHENMIVDRPLIVRCDLVIDPEDIPRYFLPYFWKKDS